MLKKKKPQNNWFSFFRIKSLRNAQKRLINAWEFKTTSCRLSLWLYVGRSGTKPTDCHRFPLCPQLAYILYLKIQRLRIIKHMYGGSSLPTNYAGVSENTYQWRMNWWRHLKSMLGPNPPERMDSSHADGTSCLSGSGWTAAHCTRSGFLQTSESGEKIPNRMFNR